MKKIIFGLIAVIAIVSIVFAFPQHEDKSGNRWGDDILSDKDIYYNASRIIYNVLEIPDDSFLENIKNRNIILEFGITYQSFFNMYDDLKNHIIYDLYKLNILIAFTTIDMTSLDTDLLNEYCKIFNVFPFSLHDLVNISLNILNNINIDAVMKNNLISEFREKANLLL